MTLRRALALVLALAAGSAAHARSWEHAAFASGSRRPARLLVLPPVSSMVRAHVNEGEPMIAETAVLERHLAELTAARLRQGGYDVEILTPADLEGDRELADLVERFQARANETLSVAVQSPRDVRRGRFSLGDVAAPLAAATDAEGFLVLRAQSIVPSRGTRGLSGVLSTVFGGLPYVPRTKTALFAVEVEGRTGDVLALFHGQEPGAVLKRPERVAQRVVREAFGDHPGLDERRRVARSDAEVVEGAQEEAEPAAPAAMDEAALLARFEAAASGAEDPADVASPEADEPEEETVAERSDFAPEGPVSLRAEAPDAPATAVADTAAEARAILDRPAVERPPPTVQFILQVTGGEPALAIVNATLEALRVSVDAGPFVELRPGRRLDRPAAAGGHRVLAVDAAGRELGRAFLLIPPDGHLRIEVRPL